MAAERANADEELRALYSEHLGQRARELMERLAGVPAEMVTQAALEYLTEREGGA